MRKLLLGALVVIAFSTSAYAELRTFRQPRMNGMRLDWCLTWATDGGKPAADAFCEARGFEGAMSFTNEPNVGSYEPTRLITGQVCRESFCNGFGQITCAR